jgi:hypothetical protein
MRFFRVVLPCGGWDPAKASGAADDARRDEVLDEDNVLLLLADCGGTCGIGSTRRFRGIPAATGKDHPKETHAVNVLY